MSDFMQHQITGNENWLRVARPETPKKNYGKSYKQICTENGLTRVNQAHHSPEEKPEDD